MAKTGTDMKAKPAKSDTNDANPDFEQTLWAAADICRDTPRLMGRAAEELRPVGARRRTTSTRT